MEEINVGCRRGGGMYKGEFNGIFGGLLCTRQWGLRCCGGGGCETVKRNSYYCVGECCWFLAMMCNVIKGTHKSSLKYSFELSTSLLSLPSTSPSLVSRIEGTTKDDHPLPPNK